MINPYIAHIAAGKTLQEIADQHQTTPTAIQKSLRRDGLPTCAAAYLRQMNKRMLAPSVTRVVGAVA